jgi:reductive dehalogenase
MKETDGTTVGSRGAAGENDRRKLDRRDFLKCGIAGVAAAGCALTAPTAYSYQKAQGTVAFPNVITDQCGRFDHKYTVFARAQWEPEMQKKWIKFVTSPPIAEPGRTQLDKALYNAGWAVEYRLAEWSMNGQPKTDAYKWVTWTNPQRYEFSDPVDASRKVKRAARFLGARLVGIASYNPLWTYSHLMTMDSFRNTEPQHWVRQPTSLKHIETELPFEPKSVVVMAVEMDYGAIACSPTYIAGAGTGLGYSRMAELGWSVRRFLSELGYRSFANGNDTTLSIPYAIAAGLGECGRHGCLITQELGPRVRLVKVFTELDLKPDTPRVFGAADFCRNCGRCAESCPSKAIPFGEKTFAGETISNNPGVEKWYINPEKCFQFWVDNGVDCANCIASCPYNKTDMWNHRMISKMTELPGARLHSAMAKLDEIFGYGNTFDVARNADWWDD